MKELRDESGEELQSLLSEIKHYIATQMARTLQYGGSHCERIYIDSFNIGSIRNRATWWADWATGWHSPPKKFPSRF